MSMTDAAASASTLAPTSNLVNPLLVDFYALTMAYGFWRAGKHEEPAVFDLFFRKCPFGGEFAVFAGLDEVLRLLASYHFDAPQLAYARSQLPDAEPGFFDWLAGVDASRVRVQAPREGTFVFPREPLLSVEGPLAVGQLLEAALLNLVNYPTLVATQAARLRLAAGPGKTLLEFGLRRAQGPDGGLSASRYSYLGGFDATSNVEAGYLFGIPVKGTHAHSWVQAFRGLDEAAGLTVPDASGEPRALLPLALHHREALGFTQANDDELAAFVAYAAAFPRGFLALVDTYDTLKSGVPNFVAVALALLDLGYRPQGIRLDSGDLAYLSKEARRTFREVGSRAGVDLSGLRIVASNDLDEATLLGLSLQGHEIDVFGVGTNLVTCETQPALGGVYKLVEVAGHPRIKLSQDVAKVTIPGRKAVYRLLGAEGSPILDLMTLADEPAPQPGVRVLCRHPFEEARRAYVTPTEVVPLRECVWDGEARPAALQPLAASRSFVLAQLEAFRPDHLRAANPTPYKVSVSPSLYDHLHRLWLAEAPIGELR